MYIIPPQAIALYLISEFLHRYMSSGSRTLFIVLMLPGTMVHEFSHAVAALLMGARITGFSVMPSVDTLGHVEHTPPKIPFIGNAAISIAPLIGCPAVLLLISSYSGVHFDTPPGTFDIFIQARFLIEGTFFFIIGLDYLNWKTYLLLYLALTMGAGAAPSKTDIFIMLPGLIIIVAAIYALNYFGIDIPYLYNVFSWLSTALSVAIIPLLALAVIVAMFKLVAAVKSA